MSTSFFSWRRLGVGIGSLLLAVHVSAAETGSLDPHLEAFRPFLGKTWRGEFKDSKPDKPTFDVVRWERALDGKAVRVTHSVNDGVYGGESLIVWNQEKSKVCFHYFTTAGFYSTGVVTFSGGRLLANEKVVGNTNGVTEVRSTYELRADGTMLNKSEYLKNDLAAGGREVLYKEDPTAEVKFK